MTTPAGPSVADELADELMRLGFEHEPLGASLVGIPGHDAELGDPSAAAEAEVRRKALDIAARADAVDQSTVDAKDAVTLAVVAQQGRTVADRLDAKLAEYTITDLFIAPAAGLLTLLPMLPLPDAERAADYLTRLRALPDYLGTVAERHREGVAAGRVPVAHVVQSAIAHLDRYLADPAADMLRRPAPPAEIAESFTAERDRVLEEIVRPTFAKYRDVLVDEIVPHARPEDRVGLT